MSDEERWRGRSGTRMMERGGVPHGVPGEVLWTRPPVQRGPSVPGVGGSSSGGTPTYVLTLRRTGGDGGTHLCLVKERD